MQKILKIGIMPREAFQARSIAIARGDYKPRPDDPKIWFESIQSLAQVLSEENRTLLQIIADQKPESIKALGNLSGRKSSNLSRTLRTMEAYGIVELVRKNKKEIRPVAKALQFQVDFGVSYKQAA
jgi:predicted transcriptional regulator